MVKKGKNQHMEGYQIKGDTAIFIFDERAYQSTDVEKVAVTGEFRGWNQNMKDRSWSLKKKNKSRWVLKIENKDWEVIRPQSEFKFRINEGEWMAPPSGAPNARNGNLVFMHDVTLPTLQVEIRNSHALWAKITGVSRPLTSEDYLLEDAEGNVIKIAEVLPNTASETLIIPATAIDKRRIYFLSIPAYQLRSWCSFDGWFRELYSSKELGANVNKDEMTTSFRIFAPRAERVVLYLYKNHQDATPYQTIPMTSDENMVWEAEMEGDLVGVFYDFTIHGTTDPGNHFYESLAKHISDPYARVNMDAWGKSMVAYRTTPATPLPHGIPPMEDVIAYEVHVQDFTDLLPVPADLKGTMTALHVPGLKNKMGYPVGFDYLKNLGINTLHLMPIQEFMHHPDNEWKQSFQQDEFMIENGIADENYQWGYRTSHCFAVENKYRTKNAAIGQERKEFRDLVQAYHDAGIAVIIDIVPNHTAEDMDGNWFFHFNVIDKLYYYRTKDLDHIGEYGNEVKTENRPMVQKWLIDQCLHFINEFGIDGFRIDLAGQIDQQTLKKLKDAIGHDKILYGEPWIASNDPNFEANPDWDWYKADAPITFFQDDARNAFKGPTSNPHDKYRDRGYAGGNLAERNNVMRALANQFPDDQSTISGINYLDIHDNWTLADQFALKDWDGRYGVDIGAYKIAATLLFTSMGPIVMNGGSEMMRSKGDAELKETVQTLGTNTLLYFHGKRDTYNMRKANQFKWEELGPHSDEYQDKSKMYQFWQDLIKLRTSKLGDVFRKNFKTPSGYYQFFTPEDSGLLGYIVDGKIAVFINVHETGRTFRNITLPSGKWYEIGNNNGIDIDDSNWNDKDKKNGGEHFDIELKPQNFKLYSIKH